MHRHQILLTGVVALSIAGCNPFRQPARLETDPTLYQRWNAALATPSELSGAVQLHGSAWMAPASDGRRTQVSVSVRNATPGGVHPWEIREGRCGDDEGDFFGESEDYKHIKVDDDGEGTVTAAIREDFPEDGEYFVLVHASPNNLNTIVACGNLAPPTP